MSKKENEMLNALMEEYRRSTIDLKKILSSISYKEFENIKNPVTKDPDCKSIQSIIRHVISSGYVYANMIRGLVQNNMVISICSPSKAIVEIDKMLDYTDETLKNLVKVRNSEVESLRYKAKWGTTYDLEQLMEHAIVHMLRHRRQIENFVIRNSE